MDCPECARLSEEVWSPHAEVVGSRDELKITPKADAGYAAKKLNLGRLKRLQRDAIHRSSIHTKTHRD